MNPGLTETLKGKTALITGAAKRIGRTIALRLAHHGVHICLNYRSSSREAEQTRREIQDLGVQALAMRADLTRLEDCQDLIERVTREAGAIDILVNNASDFTKTPLQSLGQSQTTDEFASLFDHQTHLHMRAPLYLGTKLGLLMKQKGWGRIVNITDRVVVKGQAYRHWPIYLATKYGLYGVTQALAAELNPEVTVNSIAPGLVIPPPDMTAEQVERQHRRIPLGRSADPEEIAADVLHLIRSEAKTGVAILTDGGASMRAW